MFVVNTSVGCCSFAYIITISNFKIALDPGSVVDRIERLSSYFQLPVTYRACRDDAGQWLG